MASRNPHSGDPRPGPSRGFRFVPGTDPAEAERRIAKRRFPSFQDYGISSPEIRLSGDYRFKKEEYVKSPKRRIEGRKEKEARWKREKALKKYLERTNEANIDKIMREEKETSEANQEAYNKSLTIPLFEVKKEEDTEMSIEIKKELVDEDDPPEEIAPNEVKEGSMKCNELIRSIMETLIEPIEQKNDPSRSELVMERGEEEEMEMGVDEVEKEETSHAQLEDDSLSGRHPTHHSKDRTSESSATPSVLRRYKVMFDHSYMTHLKTKDFVRRVNGKCPEKYKQFDYPQAPIDPRIKFRRVDQPKDLTVPNLVIDDQYTGIPPKREVTISNLNDNANREFLITMARKQKFEPLEVQVFYHPTTGKHLEMAIILFSKSKDAKTFVEASNGMSVMGKPISCRLDPFAAELNAEYFTLTNAPLPPLKYLSGMSEHELSLRREKIIGGNVEPSPSVEILTAPPIEVKNEDELNRSLSPMDTSNSPVHFEPMIPPPPIVPPVQQHLPYYDDAGASTSKGPSPPPPYSELPPINHSMKPEEERRRSTSRIRSTEPEGRAKSNKRRHASTSSSSSSSGEDESKESRRRSDGGVKKKKREEYLKVKRYVSSERDSNGEKRILKEIKTVTYKRRTEQRTTIAGEKKKSPDSFDEEMKRRASSGSNKSRGKDDIGGWSSPSSDSDSGRGRRKRAKDRPESHSKADEKLPPPPDDPLPSSTPLSFCSTPSTTSTPSRRSGFHSAPVFDPTQPPPVSVPPVGIVVLPGPSPSSSSVSLAPPSLIPMPPMPPMMIPPPPLPGGFIPPPEFFGIQSNPAMLQAVTAHATGMAPLPGMTPLAGMTPLSGITPLSSSSGSTPLNGPPPSPMSSNSGYGATPGFGTTPINPFSSPAKAVKPEVRLTSVSSPLLTSSGMTRASREGGRTPRAPTTPPSEGNSTPTTVASAEKEKKGNLDDRLSELFPNLVPKKVKKVEETREMKHVASAPSISTMEAEQRHMEDDDMDIADDDDDMDISSPEVTREEEMMMEMERGEGGGRGGGMEDETRLADERAERKKMEDLVRDLTRETLETLVMDLQQQITRDLCKTLETTALGVVDEWEKRQKRHIEEEEKKKNMIRSTLALLVDKDHKPDPTEQMLLNTLASPENAMNGSKMFNSTFKIIKKQNLNPVYSRDGTPVSDSRAPSRTKSRSGSRSSSRSSSSSRSDDDDDEMEEEEEEVRKAVRRRPNMRNIESSQESSIDSTSESESESEDELDVVGGSEDEFERTKKEIKDEEGVSSPDLAGSSSSAASPSSVAASSEQELPFSANRTIVPNAMQRGMVKAGAARVSVYPPSPLVGSSSAAGPPILLPQQKPIKTKKDVQSRIEAADRLPHSLLKLLPTVERKKPKKTFNKRSEEEEKRILDSFKAGVDQEDDLFLKGVLEEMQRNGARPFGVDREVEFESFLRAYTPLELTKPTRVGRTDLYYDDEELAGLVPHSTGSARSEGFYRLTNKQKIRILRRPEAFQDRTEINERDEVVTRHQLHAQKEQRSMNRRLLTMADSNPNSDFFKVNQLKYRKKMIKFARSRIHGWGLYALEPIAPDDMIVEYIGQKIRPIVAEEREKQYERRGIGSSYLFRIDEDEVIDATRQGNFARFINHSCQPNCYAKVVTVDGDKRIVIYSKTLIQKGDEITYDYKFPVEEDKIECLCGAPACRGTLN